MMCHCVKNGCNSSISNSPADIKDVCVIKTKDNELDESLCQKIVYVYNFHKQK